MDIQEKQAAVQRAILSKEQASPFGKTRAEYQKQQARHHQVLKQVASTTEGDKEFQFALLRADAMAIGYLPEDADLIQLAVNLNPASVRMLSAKWRDDDKLMHLALERDGSALQFASERIRNDAEVVQMVADSDWQAASEFMGSKLKALIGFDDPIVALPRIAKAQKLRGRNHEHQPTLTIRI